jgi:hypothetical protein
LKKQLSVSLAALVLAAACLTGSATEAQTSKEAHAKDFKVNLNNNTNFDAEQNPTSQKVASEKLGYDIQHPEKTKLVLNLHTEEQENGGLRVGGNGVLHVGTSTYPFSVLSDFDGMNSEIAKVEANGKTYYKGVLQGVVKSKKGEDTVSISATFSEDQKDQVFNVIVGGIGEDVYLSFGDNTFLTQELYDKLTNE